MITLELISLGLFMMAAAFRISEGRDGWGWLLYWFAGCFAAGVVVLV